MKLRVPAPAIGQMPAPATPAAPAAPAAPAVGKQPQAAEADAPELCKQDGRVYRITCDGVKVPVDANPYALP